MKSLILIGMFILASCTTITEDEKKADQFKESVNLSGGGGGNVPPPGGGGN